MSTRLILRMTAPVVAISLLLLGVGVGTAWQVASWQGNVSQDLRASVSGIRAGEELEILVREARTRVDQFLITRDPTFLAEALDLRGKTEDWLAEAEQSGITPELQKLMARARKGNQHFWSELQRINAAVPSTGFPNGQIPTDLAAQIRELIDNVLVKEIQDPAQVYLDQYEVEVNKSIDKNQGFADRLVYALLLLGTCGSAAGLVAGFGFARGLSRSLVQLSVLIRDAAGRLDVGVEPISVSAGELPQLKSAMRLIAERVTDTVDRLQQREREILQAKQLAAVGQLAAGLAHELRNPLTSMKMLVQGAMAGQDGQPGQVENLSYGERDDGSDDWAGPGLRGRDLAVLEEEISRLEHLTQSFLDFAQPPKPVKQEMDVRPLVKQTLALLAGRATAAAARVEFVAPATPVTASLDPGQFRQVLLNLVLNAFDALPGTTARRDANGRAGQSKLACPTGSAPAREATITVRLQTELDGGLTLEVADSGSGLPPHLGDHIFDPFTTTKETGVGLGLSICKRIVEAHGGTLAGANRPEGGAVFTFRLPGAG